MPAEAQKRQTRVSIDLLSYKEPWLNWCRTQGIAPGAAFRQIVAKLTAGQGRALTGQSETAPASQSNTTPAAQSDQSEAPGQAALRNPSASTETEPQGQGRARLPVPTPRAGPAEKPTIRKEIALTASEAASVAQLAQSEGFAMTKWIVALIRARLEGSAQFGQSELELLARSNQQLLAVGRNLNQVARALNVNPDDHSIYRVHLIEALAERIATHTQLVRNAINANRQRWQIK